MSSPSTTQTTLLTSHKGVDLHAATALHVMKDRLEGGHLLEGLFRCEMHTFWGEEEGVSLARLLDVGRYFNPNKHHYGHFALEGPHVPWLQTIPAAHVLDERWPGDPVATDLDPALTGKCPLYDLLLGGIPESGIHAVDVVSFPFGQDEAVLSGVLWRLLIRGGTDVALEVGRNLAVASHRKEGLLVNPHMEAWLAVRR